MSKFLSLCYISPGCVAGSVTAGATVRRAGPTSGAQFQVVASSSRTECFCQCADLRTRMVIVWAQILFCKFSFAVNECCCKDNSTQLPRAISFPPVYKHRTFGGVREMETAVQIAA